jgi:hypothetical protein
MSKNSHWENLASLRRRSPSQTAGGSPAPMKGIDPMRDTGRRPKITVSAGRGSR